MSKLEPDPGCSEPIRSAKTRRTTARSGKRAARNLCRAFIFCTIKIGGRGRTETFVDGTLGYNNPIEQVLEEAKLVFPGRKVACVVSIGTGIASAITFPDSPKTCPSQADRITEGVWQPSQIQQRRRFISVFRISRIPTSALASTEAFKALGWKVEGTIYYSYLYNLSILSNI